MMMSQYLSKQPQLQNYSVQDTDSHSNSILRRLNPFKTCLNFYVQMRNVIFTERRLIDNLAD